MGQGEIEGSFFGGFCFFGGGIVFLKKWVYKGKRGRGA